MISLQNTISCSFSYNFFAKFHFMFIFLKLLCKIPFHVHFPIISLQNTISGLFSYNSFVKFQGKKILEPQHYRVISRSLLYPVCYKGTALLCESTAYLGSEHSCTCANTPSYDRFSDTSLFHGLGQSIFFYSSDLGKQTTVLTQNDGTYWTDIDQSILIRIYRLPFLHNNLDTSSGIQMHMLKF